MAEIRKETRTAGGTTISLDVLRGRQNPNEINRIKNDGNTSIKAARQEKHEASLGDRLNAVLMKVHPEHEQRVRSGIWGQEGEREVPEELHTDDERRMLDAADEGTVIKETILMGAAPYEIRDLGGGRMVIRVTRPDSSVIVGVGATIEAAVAELEKQVAK